MAMNPPVWMIARAWIVGRAAKAASGPLSQRIRRQARVAASAVPFSVTLAFVAGAGVAAETAAPPAPLTPEISDVATLPPAGPHRLWVQDWRTGATQVIEGDVGDLVATVPGSDLASISADAGQRHIYVAESIWTKGNRGQRQDLLSVYDGSSLKLLREIPLPGRVYMVPTDNIFALSSSGSRAYIYNMQPSSSVVVVDLDKQAVLRTVETPGCALAFPWGAAGFSSLCGDGSLATITTSGPKPMLSRSTAFFDAEHDPVFEASPTDAKTGQTLFVTYSGVVHPVQLGSEPTFGAVWSLQQAAGLPAASLEDGSLAWRPGGYTPMALHRRSGRLYVLMHAGEHWTQKKNGTELWVVDVQTRKVIRRAALETPAGAVRVSQDDHPLLYLMDEKPGLSIRDANTLEELRRVDEDGFSGPIAPPL